MPGSRRFPRLKPDSVFRHDAYAAMLAKRDAARTALPHDVGQLERLAETLRLARDIAVKQLGAVRTSRAPSAGRT